MNLRLILGGLKSYLPVSLSSYAGTGGSTTGAYCYSVWLRHLAIIDRHVPGFRPRVVAEMGPGDSIGLGLAALLTTADVYYGLDVLEHADRATNERVLADLVRLLQERAPLPGDDAFPKVFPRLADYGYPAHLLDERKLAERLAPGWQQQLRDGIAGRGPADGPIRYRCPWTPASVGAGEADLVISQVALQDMDHTTQRDDLLANLRAMAGWLRPGGVMSHQVDLSCPGGAPWNHHWGYGDLAWTLIRGKRPYYVNRVPLSEYERLFAAVGCRVVGRATSVAPGLPREALAPAFRGLPAADLETRDALIIAVKQ